MLLCVLVCSYSDWLVTLGERQPELIPLCRCLLALQHCPYTSPSHSKLVRHDVMPWPCIPFGLSHAAVLDGPVVLASRILALATLILTLLLPFPQSS